jgi:hypothetical protein
MTRVLTDSASHYHEKGLSWFFRITQYNEDTHNARTLIPMDTRTQTLPLWSSSKTAGKSSRLTKSPQTPCCRWERRLPLKAQTPLNPEKFVLTGNRIQDLRCYPRLLSPLCYDCLVFEHVMSPCLYVIFFTRSMQWKTFLAWRWVATSLQDTMQWSLRENFTISSLHDRAMIYTKLKYQCIE